ncbi:MAG: bacteriocin [Tatlockia sp.]|nr:bacteriocin [Tatlockia sp.]
MENDRARPLAYTLAKELNSKELDEVSGGEGGIHICMLPTQYETNKSTLDATADYRVDW